MRRLVLKMHLSVDGFACGPGGEVDWIFPTLDEEASSWVVDTLWRAGAHLMGSRTYRDMAAHWPASTEAYARPMNEIPKVVFSRRADLDTPWGETTVARGELAAEIGRLKRQPGKDLLAHGGAAFARALAREGLVDEYRLVVHPVVLGRGVPIFSELPKPREMSLQQVRPFWAGATAMVYRPAVAA